MYIVFSMECSIGICMNKVRYNTNSRSLYDLSLGKETVEERGARRSSIIHTVVMIPVASLSDYRFRVAQAVMINNTVASCYKQNATKRRSGLYFVVNIIHGS
jgi:hypothetical protein